MDRDARLRRRPARVGTGQSYYGFALKQVIAGKPPESKVERDAQLTWLIVIVVTGLAIGLAVLIVL